MAKADKAIRRADRRRSSVRRRLKFSGRPRLSVFRSAKFIYAQVIDDDRHVTVAAADSRRAVAAGEIANGGNAAAAKLVGQKVAEAAKSAGVDEVVFDRGPYQFHGRVKALADAAREAGLKF
jgi:large subunit ribosomal protein L18